MTKQRWLFGWGLGSIAAGAASLLVPLYVVQLGGTAFELGLLGAVAAFIGAPGALVWGRLADKAANPRRIIVASLVGVGGLLTVMPHLSSIPLLILLNALVWLVFAAGGPILTLLVVADVPERDWNQQIALLNKFQGYGWAGGLFLGIIWSAVVGRIWSTTMTQQSLFVACGGVAILAAVLLGQWMPSPTTRQLGRIEPQHVAKYLSAGRRGIRGATFLFNPNRLFWSTRHIHPKRVTERFTLPLATYYLGVLVFFIGFAAFFAPLPLYLTGVGFSSDLVFGLYLVSSLGAAAFYTAAGRLSTNLDLRVLQSVALGSRGILISLVALVGAGLAAGLVGTVVMGLLFLGIGVTWAVIAVTAGTIVTRIAPPSVRGEALGMYAALAAFAGGVGSIGGGALASALGFSVAFGTASVVIFSGAGLIFTLREISTGTKMNSDGPPQRNEEAVPTPPEN